MTVEQKVASLTTSVDQLTDAVNVKKQTLDASVADSTAARDASQAARDTAGQHKDSAAASATQVSNTATSISGFDLKAIAQTKADTAVDVFVYDTSQDSEGGAWRHRTQHTSWYNEPLNTATRGARREFPAVAVIVAESDKVTIYDGDDPALPMWMIANRVSGTSWGDWISFQTTASVTSVLALNGILCIGTTGSDRRAGLTRANFISDVALRDSGPVYNHLVNLGDISERNTLNGKVSEVPNIISSYVNDVAMIVLPDAPIDPATGLPTPTIAVATGGGLSVISHEGNVFDSAYTVTLGHVTATAFGVWYTSSNASQTNFATWEDVYAGDGFGDTMTSSNVAAFSFPMVNGRHHCFVAQESNWAAGSINGIAPGFMLHQPNYTDQSKGMSALTTRTYTTGWMPGRPKGVFLSDTDDTDMVGGSTEVSPNVGNPFVDTVGISNDSLTTVVSGNIEITAGDTWDWVYWNIPVTAGFRYEVELTGFKAASAVGEVKAWTGWESDVSAFLSETSSVVALSLVARSTGNARVLVYATQSNYSGGDVVIIERFSVIKIPSDFDRSVNNNPLTVNGTVTREPVATGADLVAYSGFSVSNYLEQPYNPDLDFGTGDFCVMGWAKTSSTTTRYIIDRTDPTNAGARLRVAVVSGNLYVSAGASNTAGIKINRNSWRFVVAMRKSGILQTYIDGEETSSTTSTDNINNTSATLRVGLGYNDNGPWDGALALLRISATAPTPEQFKRIYEDEKVLFQENAACTLYGTSDAVTALAHDEVTDLLHVGTSDGRSVFQGLRRVENTTDAVGTAISASNNLIVEE